MSASPDLPPLPAQLLLGDDLLAYIGPLGSVAAHEHRAAALLLSLDAPFRIRAAGEGWRSAQGALVPPGLRHQLDCGQQRLAVIYLDPVVHGPRLTPGRLWLGGDADAWVRAARDLLPTQGPSPLAAMRERLIGEVLPAAGVPLAASAADARLLRLRELLQQEADWTLALPAAAQRAGLSASRFSHLFAECSGVGWTAYRNWMRLAEAIRALSATSRSLTEVALDAGFSSAAHFSAAFRGSFGITPSELRRARPQLLEPRP